MIFELQIGSMPVGVRVEPDVRWPGMWRVRMGERLSDLVNLIRAKDAAITWARPRGLGGSETVTWHRRETTSGEAVRASFEVGPLSHTGPGAKRVHEAAV